MDDKYLRYYTNIAENYNIAIIKLIEQLIKIAKEARKSVSICGELAAANKTLTDTFLRNGIDELSMSPLFNS